MRLLRLISWPYARKHLLRWLLTTAGIILGVGVFVGMHTANQSVSGIMIASQVVRRWSGVRSVLSRPSHKPSAISPWAINWCAEVGTPLAGIIGCQ